MNFPIFKLMLLSITLVGLYSPISYSMPKSNFHFEPSQTLETDKSESYTQFLLYKEKGEHCIIPLNEQTGRVLNTKDLMDKNYSEHPLAFEESIEDLKLCQPEVAQFVLSSIDNRSANQVATVFVVPSVLKAVATLAGYTSFCAVADYATDKRDVEFEDESAFGRISRFALGTVCLPIYAVINGILYYNYGITEFD